MLPEGMDYSLLHGRNAPEARRPVSTIQMAEMSEASPGDPVGLSVLAAALWRRRIAIALGALLGVIAALCAGLLVTPVFRAHTVLRLEGFNEQVLRSVSPVSLEIPNASVENYLVNEVKVLQSETLAKRVADRLAIQGEQNAGKLETVEARLRSLFHLGDPAGDGVQSDSRRDDDRIAKVRKALTVRTSLQSQVIDLFYESSNPRQAAQGANTAAAEFIELNREAREQLTVNTTEWLRKQASRLKGNLERSNTRLQDFALQNGLIFAGSQSTLAQDRVRELQLALARAESDRAAKQARYEAAVTGSAEITSERSTTGPLRQYQTDLAAMRRQLAELKTTYTPDNFKIKRLEAQIAETQATVRSERADIVGTLRSDYVAAVGLERMLKDTQSQQLQTVEQQMENERRYSVLKSEADTTQKLYESLLEKLNDASAVSALRMTDVRVIDPARVPSAPYSPNLPLNAAVGFAIGVLGSAGLVLARQRSHIIKVTGEARVLNIQELGVIPAVRIPRLLGLPSSGLQLAPASWEQAPALRESFQAALTSILFSQELQRAGSDGAAHPPRGRVVTVTSIDAHEGKTTVLMNLGIAAASRKRNVLLIDADLRKPRLHDLFKLPNDLGVTDVLPRCATPGFIENSPLEALVRRTQIPNLWVMPSGPGSATVESLLSSPDLGILLQRFRRDFDLIFIDTPPLAMYADSRIVGRLSDGVVIVIRANTKSREELKSAYARLMQDQIQILGTILNGWRSDPSKIRAYRDYNYNRQPAPRRPA